MLWIHICRICERGWRRSAKSTEPGVAISKPGVVKAGRHVAYGDDWRMRRKGASPFPFASSPASLYYQNESDEAAKARGTAKAGAVEK